MSDSLNTEGECFMRKFMLIFMAMSLLFMSGCGGSIYDDDTGDDPYADTYPVKTFLSGRWVITEGEGEAVSTTLGSEATLTLSMNSAQMNFSNIEMISGDTGTAVLYYSHKWQAFDDSDVYVGEFDITSYRSEDDRIQSQVVNLTHVDVDKWRVDDADGNIIMIEFTSPYSISTAWEGFSYSDNAITSGDVTYNERVKDYHYTLECSFRKQ